MQSVGLSNLLSLSRHTVSMLSEAFLLSTRDRVSLRPAKGSSAPLSLKVFAMKGNLRL
ncbi:hypothetical protein LC609_06570 [Nostoc sp. XA013]|nr:hypothetical protein [Nostoc sp. XA013]